MRVRELCALGACISLAGVTPSAYERSAPWTATQIVSLHERIDAIARMPALRGAQVGFLAVDVARGTVLYSRNADSEFTPASNFKLLVGSAALTVLGPNFSFTTTLLSDAPPEGSSIDGNLYLHGGGDAHLGARALDAAAAAVARVGVTHVTGAIVTDASHDDAQRWAPGWSWDDLPYAYAPVVSALELEEGVVHVTISAGASPGAPVLLRETPQSNAFTIENQIVTGARHSTDTSDVKRPWDAPRTIALVGSYPIDATTPEEIDPSVPDPESYAGDVLLRALAAHGVRVDAGVRSGRTPPRSIVLWSHASATTSTLLAQLWLPSDNVMAELFLKELGVARTGEPGTYAAGRLVERRYLTSIGADPATVSIADGSGLSQYDRLTPRDLVAILEADWRSPYWRIVIDALPLAGVRGTLVREFLGTAAQGRVYAKTGSMNHVRTLSGYVKTRTHGIVAFSLLVNDWMGEEQPNGVRELASLRGAIVSALASR